LNETLKENVLFGSEYNKNLFDLAIHAAVMEDDIAMLPDKVLTEIGEKGINLSGGQKARCSLARAIYRDADIYLLDDPLSAVDAHVSEHIFNRCILGALRDKTRILVTHQVHFLSRCDKVLVLEDGKMKGFGTYSETKDLIASSTTLPISPRDGFLNIDISSDCDVGPTIAMVKAMEIEKIEDSHSAVVYDSIKDESSEKMLITKEEKAEGDVMLKSYMYYLKSGGLQFFFLVIVTMLLSQFFVVFSSFWLAMWNAKDIETTEGLSASKNTYYLEFYATFLMISIGLQCSCGLLRAQHRLNASKILHNDMLKRVLGAPVAFFDTTPLGRILNRFSSDLGVVDEELSQSLNQVLNCFIQVLGCLGAISGSTKGTFLILLIPISIIYLKVQAYFRKTNTAVARLESISRSPIYADFSQVLAGLYTVRAYRCHERFVLKLEALVNRNSSAAVLTGLANQWLCLRLDILGSFISLFVCLLAAGSSNFIPPEYVGIGLSFSFQLTTFIKFGVRMSAQNEAQMNAVERVKYYADNINQEELDKEDLHDKIPAGCCGNALPVKYNELSTEDLLIPFKEWPKCGEIKAENVEMGYREGPLVLKGISFSVKGNENIGVAGRTGSGKSSLINALFRIEKLRCGRILIDGIDIASVPLQILRSRLGIIPQDPVMFSASVRFNLDPLGIHSDEELWEVLKRVEMGDTISSFPSKLLEIVSEGGENLSVGQRQLICIARVLLRRPKLLVLDEATASIDNETDHIIQRMIRDQFADSTVLTIAHRLHTIIDSDKIMVLDQGKIVEMDSPDKLLSYNSVFKALWDRHQSNQGDQSE
jgi:ATP-binding cassette, subfamily C (CFTR/MRP), member 1